MKTNKKIPASRRVYLQTEDGITYSKTWCGLTFTIELLQDGSIKFYAPDTEMQILSEVDENDPYFIANLFGGKGFIRFIKSKYDGTFFASLTITEDAQMPNQRIRPVRGKLK